MLFITAIHNVKEAELATIKRIMEPFETVVVGIEDSIKSADIQYSDNHQLLNDITHKIKT